MKINDLFKYKPPENYDFNIQTTENATVQDLNSEKIDEKVFSFSLYRWNDRFCNH